MTALAALDAKIRRDCWYKLAEGARYHPGRLAAMCQISLRQLERYFAEDFHRTPKEWLHRQRMETAKLRLTGTRSVKEVAFSLGFKNPSHFSREFKRLNGLTPTEYLRQRSDLFV